MADPVCVFSCSGARVRHCSKIGDQFALANVATSGVAVCCVENRKPNWRFSVIGKLVVSSRFLASREHEANEADDKISLFAWLHFYLKKFGAYFSSNLHPLLGSQFGDLNFYCVGFM